MMDYSHVIKRVHNHISKSGDSKNCTRKLKIKDYIFWDHWINAFKWDHDKNPFPIHRKLTYDHFYLTSESKMCNHLAEHVLDIDMLHLMKQFQASFTGDARNYLQGTIELLTQTSHLVSCFRDQHPIYDESDIRLKKNQEVLKYFDSWTNLVEEDCSLIQSASEKEKSLISRQTREDLASLIIGFDTVCKSRITRNLYSVKPCYVNSDAIENIFCQVRGVLHGLNTNPTYSQYSKTMNSIILGQHSTSRKANTGGKTQHAAQPVAFYCDKPLSPRKKLRI